MKKELGPMNREEKTVLIFFCLMALLWITRSDIEIGRTTINGWASFFGKPAFIDHGTVAIALSLPLFLITVKDRPGVRIMNRETASRIPRGHCFAFRGRICPGKRIQGFRIISLDRGTITGNCCLISNCYCVVN